MVWLGILLTGCLAGCAPAPGGSSLQADAADPLQAYLTAEPDSMGRLQPFVEVTVPRRALVFYHEDDRIKGGLEVTVVADRDGRQAGGGAGQRLLAVPDWPATRSDSLVTCRIPLVVTGDEPVNLQIKARSLGSQRVWRRRLPYRPGQLAALPYTFEAFTWNLGQAGRLEAESDTLRCRLTVAWSETTPTLDETVAQDVTARDDSGDLDRQTRLGVAVSGYGGIRHEALEPVVWTGTAAREMSADLVLVAGQLPFGKLRIVPLLAAGAGETRIVRWWQPGRQVVNYALDLDDDRIWSRQIAWLEGKFNETSLAGLEDLPPAERRPAWSALWSEVPLTARSQVMDGALREHLDLIIEADERFSTTDPGSLTDRGRAWIRYGPPDEIDTVGDHRSRGTLWEIWTYRKPGLQLTFLDSHGLGDYRLMETETLP